MMEFPSLSRPTLFTFAELQSRPALVGQIICLINDAFARSKRPDPEKWGTVPQERFPTNETYLETIGESGIVGVIYDESADQTAKEGDEDSESRKGKVVAVAAVIPWQGGFEKEGAGVEEGWEVKAVAVSGDAKYLRKGLFLQLSAALEERLVAQSLAKDPKGTEVTLWVILAECINGVYWRKRGYTEVRRGTYEKGTWGCLTGFEMVVMKRSITTG